MTILPSLFTPGTHARVLRLHLASLILGVCCVSHADPLPHSAYVWQRQWNEPVRSAVTNAGPTLAGFVVLAAEVTTRQTFRVTPDYSDLRATGRPFGIAIRVGTGATATPEFAASLLVGNGASELQIDFDCSESKLDTYRQWVTAIRAKVAPTPVTITVLPAWLRQPAFSNLVAATDGFVLQVHSFDSTLCDTGLAARAVAKAAQYGIPFRIALPTYGYVVAHDRSGKFVGISAESPASDWADDAMVDEVRADAPSIAALVREWNTRRPPNLTGIIWYRLPVATDQLNWRWSTLATIVAGRIPQPSLTTELRHPQPGLVELDLLNTGTADAFTNIGITVRWHDAALLSCDALAGFGKGNTETNAARFVGNPRLAPGETRVVAWLRFRETKEVNCEVRLE